MTEKLKCPFCGEKLQTYTMTPGRILICVNKGCPVDSVVMKRIVWQALIDGKKAQDALKSIADDVFLYHPSISEKIPWEEHYYRLKDKAKSAITSITEQEAQNETDNDI